MDTHNDDVEAMVEDGLAALDEFEKTGDRSGFKVWLDKYGGAVDRLSFLDMFSGDAVEDEIERIERELVGE